MKIVVCLKQVPDTTAVKIDPKTGTLIRDGVPSIINPEDKHALEAALQLKDNNGAEVTVLSAIGGNVIVNIKDSRVAINKDMARHIMV